MQNNNLKHMIVQMEPNPMAEDKKSEKYASTFVANKKNQTITTKEHKKQAARRQRAHFRVDWRRLTYFRPENSIFPSWTKISKCDPPKRILSSLDGCFKSGELSAILGPSGAGKSTFLDCLFGRKQDDAFGETKVTWLLDEQQRKQHELDAKLFSKRDLSAAIVPQDDHLLKSLTVQETLMFASRIKNTQGDTLGKNFHKKNVKRVAMLLKLNECLYTKCGKLSGGQRKRVSIGQELLSQPDVIVLDEPTSGLDALTCLSTIKCLKSLVMRQKICIVLTIHQPDTDVFNLFDTIYVIAQGGVAIYDGSPQQLAARIAQVGLEIPVGYNPARFIVENAFSPASAGAGNYVDNEDDDDSKDMVAGKSKIGDASFIIENSTTCNDTLEDLSEDSDWGSDKSTVDDNDKKSELKRSVLSLAGSIVSGLDGVTGKIKKKTETIVTGNDKRPLLNLGVKTRDGQLITSDDIKLDQTSALIEKQRSLLLSLNKIQKSFYRDPLDLSDICSRATSASNTRVTSPISTCDSEVKTETGTCGKLATCRDEKLSSSCCQSDYSSLEVASSTVTKANNNSSNLQHADCNDGRPNPHNCPQSFNESMSLSSSDETSSSLSGRQTSLQLSEFGAVHVNDVDHNDNDDDNNDQHMHLNQDQTRTSGLNKLRRKFDKRLSAKHNFSKRKHPTLYHSMILTHRTWLSIIRDPVFFGIQLAMHTCIPLILAGIFGSAQEEACPKVGSFDIVDFAYTEQNAMRDTLLAIRHAISNVGILFFQMFVLCFAINCITALVFPLDMQILAKEFRNGWYDPVAYMIARTLADLPIPVVLHTMALAILYYLSGQAHSMYEWRFLAINLLMIIGSLVAQSVGLTTGAILMKSQQSAVLTAAALTAPTFALSGYIVRIYNLPFLVRAIANATSYLYHLLNGFIILRYGYGRCSCNEEDFIMNPDHKVPKQIETMASMWIGTFSDEYPNSSLMKNLNQVNNTNIDPNIDIVKKMVGTFSMATSFGQKINNCSDVLPYAMLDFGVNDSDIWICFASLLAMAICSRLITFASIYFKIMSHI